MNKWQAVLKFSVFLLNILRLSHNIIEGSIPIARNYREFLIVKKFKPRMRGWDTSVQSPIHLPRCVISNNYDLVWFCVIASPTTFMNPVIPG
jgi:hypothetical protein